MLAQLRDGALPWEIHAGLHLADEFMFWRWQREEGKNVVGLSRDLADKLRNADDADGYRVVFEFLANFFFKIGSDIVRYNLPRVLEALAACEQGGPQKKGRNAKAPP